VQVIGLGIAGKKVSMTIEKECCTRDIVQHASRCAVPLSCREQLCALAHERCVFTCSCKVSLQLACLLHLRQADFFLRSQWVRVPGCFLRCSLCQYVSIPLLKPLGIACTQEDELEGQTDSISVTTQTQVLASKIAKRQNSVSLLDQCRHCSKGVCS